MGSVWMRRFGPVCLGILGVVYPEAASAHLVDVRFGDFYGGALHVLTGLQYGLLLVALSFFTALQPREQGRWMLGAVPLGMLVGGFLSAPLSIPSVTLVMTGAIGVVGALTLLARPVPAWGVAVIGFSAALLLGFENGMAMTEQTTVYLFVSGMTVAALLVVTLLSALLANYTDLGRWARISLRALGSWITAVSFILLALALAGPAQAG